MSASQPANDYDDDTISIWIKTEKLSDGSEVFNVHLGGVLLRAIDEKSAVALADDLFKTINKNSVETAEIHHGERSA